MFAVFFTRLGVALFSLLPFRAVYALSDFLFFIFKNVVKYRKTTIEQNLRNSFPEKNDAEIERLINGAYRNLCDVTVEGIKGLSMSEKTFRERYKIINPEITNADFEAQKSIILTGGHYCNWEWGVVSWSIWFQHKVIGIYKPLSNKKVEKYLNAKRSFLGMNLAATYETRNVLEENKDTACVYVLMGDQSPSNMKTTHWLTFLRQDTAWLHGVGTIAHKNNFPIYYLDTQRVRRGFYESKLSLLIENPSDFSPEEISKIYAEKLEEIIEKKPEDWLWSHKRWKHKLVKELL
jgi:Kdo2-lipid IVA lauroyltransferase/acyltransferase